PYVLLQAPSVLQETGPSFPSGHALNSAVIYLTLALLTAPLLPRRSARVYVITAALVLVFLLGVSRLYLGVHWLTGVLAGWTFGLAWAVACRWVDRRWFRPQLPP